MQTHIHSLTTVLAVVQDYAPHPVQEAVKENVKVVARVIALGDVRLLAQPLANNNAQAIVANNVQVDVVKIVGMAVLQVVPASVI